MKFTKKQIIWSFILLMVIAAATVVYFFGRSRGWFAVFESKEAVRAYVASYGGWAPVAFFFLQFIQVILSPIPGSITTIAGGLMFGLLPAFLISVAAVFLGSVCAFLLGKTFGRPLVYRIAGKDAVDKYMSAVSSRQRVVLFMMFLLPFFPDDILCLIAGLSAMRLPRFSLLVIATRPWGLLFSALIGSGIVHMPLWSWIVIGAIVAAIFILSIKYAPLIEKKSKEHLDKLIKRD